MGDRNWVSLTEVSWASEVSSSSLSDWVGCSPLAEPPPVGVGLRKLGTHLVNQKWDLCAEGEAVRRAAFFREG